MNRIVRGSFGILQALTVSNRIHLHFFQKGVIAE